MLVQSVRELEATLGMPVWLLVQGERSEFGTIDPIVGNHLIFNKRMLRRNQKIALLIESGGGSAMSAYKIAELLRRRCGGFTAVIPHYAKSAATLLALGADEILLGEDGELGPLDAQIDDPERESRNSALDEVQSLERLNAVAMEATHQLMIYFLRMSGKRIDVLLPIVLKFVADLMRPLLEDIDAVRFTQRSRALKIAEEYAQRLLQRHYSPEAGHQIASDLVTRYPEHGFPIYAEEARQLGLKIEPLNSDLVDILDRLALIFIASPLTAIGPIEEEEQDNDEEGER